MDEMQGAGMAGGGITGLVKSLITAESLDVVSEHTRKYFQQSLQGSIEEESVNQMVVAKALETDGFKIFSAVGEEAEAFDGATFSSGMWPEQLWKQVSGGEKLEDETLPFAWLGAQQVEGLDSSSVYLQTVPFKCHGELQGFYMLLSSENFRVPGSVKFLGDEFGSIVAEIIKFKKNSWTVQDRLNTFEILDNFYQKMNQLDEFEETMKFCLDTFQELFNAPDGSIMIFDPDENELKVQYTTSDMDRDPLVFEMGEGVAGTSLEENDIIQLSDVGNSNYFEEYPDFLKQTSLKSLVCVPLRTPRRAVGVVNISDHSEERDFDLDSIPGLDILKSRIASALESFLVNQELEFVANHDELTELYNRRYVENFMEEQFEAYQEDGTPFSVILLDLDKFKPINDTYGHDAGDIALIEFSNLLTEHSRGKDIGGRFGGDEFVCVLPDTTYEEAIPQGQYLAGQLDSLIIETPDGDSIDLKGSMGLGTVSRDRPKDSFEEVLKEADEKLYEAKEVEGVEFVT